jgi:hypothetical protein
MSTWGRKCDASCVYLGNFQPGHAARSPSDNHCALSHSFLPIPAASSQVAERHLEMTMAALLIGYAVAITIVFFASRPISINRPSGEWSEKWQGPINWRG